MIDLKLVFENLPGHVYWKDKAGVYLGCNKAQASNLGLVSPDEIIGKTDFDLPYGKRIASIYSANDRSVIETGQSRLVEEPTLIAGEERYVLSHKIPLLSVKREVIGVLGVSVDVTAYKDYGEQLESEKNNAEIALENIIARLPGHVYWLDRNNVYLGCNDYQAKRAGLPSRKYIIGKSNHDLPWREEASEINVINNLVMDTGVEYSVEESVRCADGGYKTFLSKKTPLFNDGGKTVGLLGLSIDITDQKNVERLLHSQIESEKEKTNLQKKTQLLKMLGGSIAHELRTPLAGLSVLASGLKNDMGVLVEAYQNAVKNGLVEDTISQRRLNNLTKIPENMVKSAANAHQIINMLLMNIKEEVMRTDDLQVNSINQTVEKALAEYVFDGGDASLVRWDNQYDFYYKGDPVLVKHVLFNLLKNAIYHIKQANKGDIEISFLIGDEGNKLIFKDFGSGIAEEQLEHVFDRFYSNRRGGTGLGLAFCKTVMEAAGGSIACGSVLGEHTEFSLNFPKTSV